MLSARQHKQKVGKWGESVAAWYLAKKGYEIVARHYTSRFGEIDLIAKDRDELVFVEVKTRSNQDTGQPEEAVNWHKLSKLKRVILAYLSRNTVEKFRLDVVAVTRLPGSHKASIRHHKSLSDNWI